MPISPQRPSAGFKFIRLSEHPDLMLPGGDYHSIEWVYEIDAACELQSSEGDAKHIELMKNVLEETWNPRLVWRVPKNPAEEPNGDYVEYAADGTVVRAGKYKEGITQGLWYDRDVKEGPFFWCENGIVPEGLYAKTTEELRQKVYQWKNPPPALEL